jgi:hypothetical protein
MWLHATCWAKLPSRMSVIGSHSTLYRWTICNRMIYKRTLPSQSKHPSEIAGFVNWLFRFLELCYSLQEFDCRFIIPLHWKPKWCLCCSLLFQMFFINWVQMCITLPDARLKDLPQNMQAQEEDHLLESTQSRALSLTKLLSQIMKIIWGNNRPLV